MAIPKFAEIKQYIIACIESGEWEENARVPSENQLAELFTCSRMTARRALTELTDNGVLERSQGLGTFVAGRKSQSSMLAIRNIADEIKDRGHGYSVQQLLLRQMNASAAIAIALEVDLDSPIFHSILVHCEQGLPLQVEERYVNPVLVPDYLLQDFSLQTPHEYLSQVAPLTEAHHTIEAVIANSELQQRLAIPATEPCLQILRRTWSRQGVVSFARLVHPGSRFKLGGHLTFSK
ncbi:histidine utilization repressor [Shewanella glacialipiscicola]|uniref:Histidine utilization repressor n=1 Tax=Shewanella glacialipiscicola TaxID=614069 RepID=A0ABQ6J709_9GAMM|nr:histidine utilization repressor [Shewanella glacialipiscicola]MCL1087196.1 histidine utilization repressor [Shewanella glacialipiscicola]MCU7994184.1 histidine utilization repressor [Shewanella glacialipiscicola]MCU8025655.1 histidine utilization repressor [Shewanella glacialipiscicola]GIU15417.1 histidine utilization repressor [Shewanella glacialipiscicola]GMA83910.1 histidine utilization repressor [Shewanella glacialipiscicola]